MRKQQTYQNALKVRMFAIKRQQQENLEKASNRIKMQHIWVRKLITRMTTPTIGKKQTTKINVHIIQ